MDWTDNDSQAEKRRRALRDRLTTELANKPVDSFLVAELANLLADEEDDLVRFTVDASHVERLGYELVGKQGTALGELVKNAYDADALLVTVEISNEASSGRGQIRIQDDGNGMSATDIRRAWMRISTSSKIDQPRSPRFGRKRAGKKGIGRFAVQRLGTSLTLETAEAGQSIGWKVVFDWDERYTRGKDITLIPNRLEQYPKDTSAHGTTLTIHNLRDEWDPDAIQSAWKSVLLLQAPLRDQGDAEEQNTAEVYDEDPGFQAFIDLKDLQGRTIATKDIETEFSQSAIAQIRGYVDRDGKAHFEVHSAKLNLHETAIYDDARFDKLGPCRLASDYFIYASDLFTALKMTSAQKIAKEIGGVRLYRNGFRVAPYGDNEDDWLGLSADSARRIILVPASNINFLGRVYIDSDANPELEETSSREGLIQNEAYRQLVRFVRECLYWAVRRVGWARDKKTTTNEPTKRATGELGEKVGHFLSQIRSATTAEAIEGASKQIADAVLAYEKDVRRAHEESIKYESMLRVLASLGLSVSVFAHEVRAASSFADDSTQIFLREATLSGVLAEAPSLQPLVNNIEQGVEKITVLGDYLGGLTAYAGTRKLSTISVPNVVQEFADKLGSYLDGQGVLLSMSMDTPPPRTCPMHRSEIDSVLFNLVSNSLKAIKRAKPEQGLIDISVRRDSKFVVVTVSDNGAGVDPSIESKIFDAFFTTTGMADDDDLVSGAGLGLKIVADIASNYGGSIRLVQAGSMLNTAMEFRVLGFDSKIHAL